MTRQKPHLHASVAAALAEAKCPTVCCTDDVTGMLRPILTGASKIQQQIAVQRERFFTAQLDSPDSDGQVERLHQTLRAMETDVQALMTAAQRIRVSWLQLGRYAQEIEDEHAPIEAVVPASVAEEPSEAPTEEPVKESGQ